MEQDPTFDPEMESLLTIMRHRETVADGLERLAEELRRRARVHDRSKLLPDEFSGFVLIGAASQVAAYGTDEYRNSMRAAQEKTDCVRLHYQRNSHHPEFHFDERRMPWLDVIEMVIDWDAAARTYGQGTVKDSLSIQRRRFQFSDSQWWLIESVANWLEKDTE